MSVHQQRPTDPDAIREEVRRGYAEVVKARAGGDGCGCGPSCCGDPTATDKSRALGYTVAELDGLPDGANLGVGCGNPTALAEITPGETIVDLGSGAGIDCFLAAKATGPEGRVIGVDMTDDMLDAARRHAESGGYDNVEFRKGLIEEMPIEDGTVDLIISNCVINLSPQKARVFAEAFRVLKPGGRLMVSDIVLDRALPDEIASDLAAYVGCIAGAVPRDEYLRLLREAGFGEAEILSESAFGESAGNDTREWASAVVSMRLRAVKSRVGPALRFGPV